MVALDVGSLARLGWWCDRDGTGFGGMEIGGLVDLIVEEISSGRSVALGFESPLFVPAPTSVEDLCRQRRGERGRPWSAGAGTAALAVGFQEATYVLMGVARLLASPPVVDVDFACLQRPEPALVVWEAFVSGKGKDRTAVDPHIDDARLAVAELRRRLGGLDPSSDVNEPAATSLIGAAILRAGLSADLTLLSRPCVVVRVPDRGAWISRPWGGRSLYGISTAALIPAGREKPGYSATRRWSNDPWSSPRFAI